MAIITIIGLESGEQDFFKDELSEHQLHFIMSDESIPPDTEVLSVSVSFTVDKALINSLPALKLIACRSTGFDNIDISTAKNRNIQVANVPSYGGTAVAEFTFLLLLAITRKLKNTLQETASIDPQRQNERGIDLAGKTLGVVGTGSIGTSVARIAKAFEMKVIAFDVYPRQENAAKIGFEYTTLEELLATADIVSLHAPSTKDTHHLINAERLALMQSNAILINTARGNLIDTTALAEALHNRHLYGAALDVVEESSAKELDTLRKHPNIIVTNHNAFNTQEAVAKINSTTYNNITSFLSGKPENTVK